MTANTSRVNSFHSTAPCHNASIQVLRNLTTCSLVSSFSLTDETIISNINENEPDIFLYNNNNKNHNTTNSASNNTNPNYTNGLKKPSTIVNNNNSSSSDKEITSLNMHLFRKFNFATENDSTENKHEAQLIHDMDSLSSPTSMNPLTDSKMDLDLRSCETQEEESMLIMSTCTTPLNKEQKVLHHPTPISPISSFCPSLNSSSSSSFDSFPSQPMNPIVTSLTPTTSNESLPRSSASSASLNSISPLMTSATNSSFKINSIHDILSNDDPDSSMDEDMMMHEDHMTFTSSSPSRCSFETLVDSRNTNGYSRHPQESEDDLLIAAHALNGLKSAFVKDSNDVHSHFPPSSSSSSFVNSDEHTLNGSNHTTDRFISRVASIPIVNSGIRSLTSLYEHTKAHSQVVQYSAEVLEKNLKPISEMAEKYLGAPMREVDNFACRQLDRLESRYPSFRTSESSIAPMLRPHSSSLSSSPSNSHSSSYHTSKESLHSCSSPGHGHLSSSSSITNERLSSLPPAPPMMPSSSTSESYTSFYKSKWQQMTAGAVAAAGAGAAVVSEESMKSLRYCLEWLQYASHQIEIQIQKLRQLTSSAVYPITHRLGTGATIVHRSEWLPDLNTIRKNIAETLRNVVEVVGKYASAFLSVDARNHVRSFILSLPARWASLNADPAASEAGEAQRVMTFASDTASILHSIQDIFSQALSTAEQWLGTLHRVPFVNSLVHPALRAYNKSFPSSSDSSTSSSSNASSCTSPPLSPHVFYKNGNCASNGCSTSSQVHSASFSMRPTPNHSVSTSQTAPDFLEPAPNVFRDHHSCSTTSKRRKRHETSEAFNFAWTNGHHDESNSHVPFTSSNQYSQINHHTEVREE